MHIENTKSVTVNTQLLNQALAGARAAGLDINRLCAKCDLDPDLLKPPWRRLPVEQVVLLHRYNNGALKDEGGGLFYRPLPLGHFRFMGLSSVHSPSLHEAFQRCVEYYNLFDNSFFVRTGLRGQQVYLELEPIPGHSVLNNHAIDYLLTSLHRFLGWLGNHRIILNQVELAFPAPAYADEYRFLYYGAPLLFRQPRTRLYFDASYLDHPVVQTESTVENYMRRAPMDLYLPLEAGGAMTEMVRNRCQTLNRETGRIPSLPQLAQELGFNPQTLRRRLKEEGASFQTIKSQLRRDIAIHLLGNTEHSIETIADQADYSEPGAFIRAFRGWTGFTPLQFRRGLES